MIDPAPVRHTTDDDDSNNNNNADVDVSPSCVLWLQNISRLATLSLSDPLYISTMTSITQWRGLAPYDSSIVIPGSPISDTHSHRNSYRYSLADLILLGDATAMALWRSYLQQAVFIMYPSSMTSTTSTTATTSTATTTGSSIPVVYNSSYNSSIAATYRRLIRYAYDTAALRQVDVFTVFSDLLLQWGPEYFLPPLLVSESTTLHDTTYKANNSDGGDGKVESYCLLDSFLPPSWKDNLESELIRCDKRHLPISKQMITMSRIPILILCLSRHFITQSEEKRLVQTLLSWIPLPLPTPSLSTSTPNLPTTVRSVAEETVPRLLLFLNWLTEYTPLCVDPSVDISHILTGDEAISDRDVNIGMLLTDYFEAKAKVCIICVHTTSSYNSLSFLCTKLYRSVSRDISMRAPPPT